MIPAFAIRQAVNSLSLAEEKFNLVESSQPSFFTEWFQSLPTLTEAEIATVDRYQQRFLAHLYRGNLSEGTVDRLLVSPLLDLAGFYEPQFVIDTETSVEVVAQDREEYYRGRIDALVIERQFWVLIIEEKATRIAMETAIPQALTYMAACPNVAKPIFGLVTNGSHFAFIKLHQQTQKEYAISDTFSLRSRQNQLHTVLQVLKQIRDRIHDK